MTSSKTKEHGSAKSTLWGSFEVRNLRRLPLYQVWSFYILAAPLDATRNGGPNGPLRPPPAADAHCVRVLQAKRAAHCILHTALGAMDRHRPSVRPSVCPFVFLSSPHLIIWLTTLRAPSRCAERPPSAADTHCERVLQAWRPARTVTVNFSVYWCKFDVLNDFE